MIATAAVEGPSDEAALRQISGSLGIEIGEVYGRNGKSNVAKSLLGFNYAARHEPWIVIIDLDKEECVVSTLKTLLPEPSNFMCLRIAVRELEAWLLADAERFSQYFSVSVSVVPIAPDDLPDPKLTLINLVRKSRRSSIRFDMVPDPKLGQSIGPAYTTRIIEYINSEHGWRVEVAAQHSPSLRRAMAAISALKKRVSSLSVIESET
jgi:hypothetical protein